MKKSSQKAGASGTTDSFHSVGLLAVSAAGGAGVSKSKRKAREKISALKGHNKENVTAPPTSDRKTLLSLITRGRLSQKVGLYSKTKVSDPVIRKGKPLKSLSSAGQDNATSLTPSSYPRECDSCTPPPPPPSSDLTEHCMEVSPEVVSMTMKDISLRILEGLKADRPFSEDAYLSNVKQELRKIMKQSNPELFLEMESCLSHESYHNTSPPPPPPPPLPPLPPPPVAIIVTSPPEEEEVKDEVTLSSSSPQLIGSTAGQFISFCPNYLYTSSPINPLQSSTNNLSALHTDPSHLSTGHTHTSFFPTDPTHLTTLTSDHTHFSTLLEGRTTDILDTADMSVQIQGSVERPRMFPHKLY